LGGHRGDGAGAKSGSGGVGRGALKGAGAAAAAAAAAPRSTRELKEAFVSFNNGTTFTEVSAITLAVPLGVAVR
jgi:hypothetical protein